MSDENPKPCPWCGVTGVIGLVAGTHFLVCCDNEKCKVNPEGPLHVDRAEAIRDWNCREAPP